MVVHRIQTVPQYSNILMFCGMIFEMHDPHSKTKMFIITLFIIMKINKDFKKLKSETKYI